MKLFHIDELKNDLIEEYQTVSPIDEEELALEFNEENTDDEDDSEKLSEVSAEENETEYLKLIMR